MTRRIAHTAQIGALVLALALVPAALAAKGGGPKGHGGTTGGSSGISAPVMVTDTGTLGLSHGDIITFTVSTTATDEPFVDVQCVQSGVLVYNSSAGFFSWAMNAPYYNFTLNSATWKSGAADCTAYLQKDANRGWSTIGSTSFHVDA